MENLQNNSEENWVENWEKARTRGKYFGGFLVVLAGLLYFAKVSGYAVPEWIFTWKTLLISLGLHVAVKHAFKKLFWLPLVLVGTIFLVAQDLAPELAFKNYLLPIGIIIVGLFIIFKPKKKWNDHHPRWKKWQNHPCNNKKSADMSTDDQIKFDIVFGGVKKNIISKDFKGGEVSIVFGGAELNLSQSDIVEKAELELRQVFGGVKLIVPEHWKIKSEITTVMGGIEDKRLVQRDVLTDSPMKILVLKGEIIFGGIEIKS